MWLSFLKGCLKAAANSACERLLKDDVANLRSFSCSWEFVAVLGLAASSLPHNSTKSTTDAEPIMFSGISLTIKWLRRLIS